MQASDKVAHLRAASGLNLPSMTQGMLSSCKSLTVMSTTSPPDGWSTTALLLLLLLSSSSSSSSCSSSCCAGAAGQQEATCASVSCLTPRALGLQALRLRLVPQGTLWRAVAEQAPAPAASRPWPWRGTPSAIQRSLRDYGVIKILKFVQILPPPLSSALSVGAKFV